jgi:beta-glucanase (GH16 family)
MGWLVGSSTYDIISISNDELFVRIIEAGDGFAWYHRFTSTKPSQDASYTYNDLVWEDDFNTDGAPDATNWTYDLGAGGWGNGEVQTYTNSAENAKVLDGSLVITAKADGSGGYTSARLKSQGLRKFTYGRIEVRAKLPASAGTWPAIWMLGSNFPTVGWPTCGEIDIMEQTGANKDITLGTLHWYNTTANGNASYGETTAVADASSDFHLYTVEWSDTSIKIYLDDVNFFQMANDSTLPFNADFFMILNIAMGGTLGGDIDPGFTEDTMEIDYVKVFQ